MSMFKRKNREIPGLNTASLPDLIFTVLFFFMIVTHMRDVELKVKYKVPQGTELQKLTKKQTVSYIYIGKAVDGGGDSTLIQLNDRLATPSEIASFVSEERQRMSADDRKRMTVSIKADRHTPMAVITQVKQALRRSNALNINYSAEKEKN